MLKPHDRFFSKYHIHSENKVKNLSGPQFFLYPDRKKRIIVTRSESNESRTDPDLVLCPDC